MTKITFCAVNICYVNLQCL